MTNRTAGIRALAALLLLLSIFGAFSRVAAQDADGASGSAELPSTYVSVACSFDDISGTSSCTFTPADPVAAVTSLFVPASSLCTAVVATSASSIEGGLYQDLAGDSIWAQFAGNVFVSGGATYSVGLNGLPSDANGDGLACQSSDDGSDIGDEAPAESTEVVTDVTKEPETDGTVEVSPEAEATAEPEASPEAGGEPGIDGGPTGDVVTEDESSPVQTTQDEQSVAVPVTVNAVIYNCISDPGSADPSNDGDCTAAAGVNVSATEDSVGLGTQTSGDGGAVAFVAGEGSTVIFSQDAGTLPSGYQPIGGSTRTLTAAEGATVVFVNLPDDVAGRLQIINGSCPTSGETRTEFRVIEPQSVAAASTPACSATGGTLFEISGGSLGSDGIVVVTGGDGSWRGYLAPGVYTVTDDSGESASVTVIADDISVVIVVDYVAAPLGVLNVSRFECSDDESAGVDISFSFDEPTQGDDSDCEATDGEVEIEVQAEVTTSSVTTVTLGSDGEAEIELPSGSYLVTDSSTGESEVFTLDAGTRVYAVIQDTVLSGGGVGPGDDDDDDDGGGDGTGNPGGGDDDDDDDNGSAGGGGDGTGNGSGNGSGNGNGNGSGGGGTGGGDTTSGGVDAGTVVDFSDEDELAGVTALPAAGTHTISTSNIAIYLGLSALASLMFIGAIANRRRAEVAPVRRRQQ